MANHAVVHFEIGGPDSKALQDFYGKLFGWTINADNPVGYPVVFKMDDGIGGGLPGSMDGDPQVTVYVTADDIRATLQKALDLGGTKAIDVAEAAHGAPTLAAFRDLDGNLIGLVHPSRTNSRRPAEPAIPSTGSRSQERTRRRRRTSTGASSVGRSKRTIR
jgi:predicted enzyme related to lactoylglutathione lyase